MPADGEVHAGLNREAAFSLGLLGCCTSGAGSFEVGVHLAFAPRLFSPDPVRAIPLLGPMGDFIF